MNQEDNKEFGDFKVNINLAAVYKHLMDTYYNEKNLNYVYEHVTEIPNNLFYSIGYVGGIHAAKSLFEKKLQPSLN